MYYIIILIYLVSNIYNIILQNMCVYFIISHIVLFVILLSMQLNIFNRILV